MRKRLASVTLALAIAMLGIPRLIQAQGLTGHISGTVTDATGGVLPGVTVTIKNVNTGLTRESVTGTDGSFVFPDLLAGTFDLNNTNSARRIQLGARFHVLRSTGGAAFSRASRDVAIRLEVPSCDRLEVLQ